MNSIHTISPAKCPACRAKIDLVKNYQGPSGPEPGHYIVCMYCGIPARFDRDLNLVLASMDDIVRDLGTTGANAIMVIQRSLAIVNGVYP